MLRSDLNQLAQRDARLTRAAAPPPAATVSRWKLVGQFSTLETAEAMIRRLRSAGVETSLSMVGGLSVIARV